MSRALMGMQGRLRGPRAQMSGPAHWENWEVFRAGS